MKNGLFKLVLLLCLVLSLTLSLASCDALGLSKDGDDTVGADGTQGTGDTDNDGDSSHTHSFLQWVEVSPATCQNEGELASICSCGERGSKPIEKTDHEYVGNNCRVCGAAKPTPEPITDTGKMDSFDYSKVPEYSGREYITVNGNMPFFTEAELVTESYESYAALDSLQRCTVAVSCIGKDIMPTDSRGSISHNPTGWVQAYYSFIGSDSLYNRCHLIAFQLTAENNNKQNLITGTRYMNEAMIPWENMVAKYVKETNNHVMYRATPIFVGDNLLAEGVLLEAYSVEDDGDGICFNIFLYNVQPGVVLNYATGESHAENSEDEKIPECDYIVNKSSSSKKIHTPDCKNAAAMSEKNKWYYTGDIEDLEAQGYTRAGCCNPS